jgi:hypothetical protein
MDLIQLLHQAQQSQKPLLEEQVDVTDIVAKIGTKLIITEEIRKLAREALSKSIKYSIESYPLKYLEDHVTKSLMEAGYTGIKSIKLINQCCNKTDCPQMVYQRLLLTNIRSIF